MLQLKQIKKDYVSDSATVNALKGVDIAFRENEFVAILGPSGCGKTTLLNIIGGLDRYTSGDLIINGKTTKEYKDGDWDTYRNKSIGFVFQSYNLIPHQTVLENVMIALSIGGISYAERKERATKALESVGIGDQSKKKPNQLSGGQMQRVAIARALVNNPDIILADEPTGALDTTTGIQVMEVLKSVAKTKLVIMVTHNPLLAEKYATRVITMLDGEMERDTNPVTEQELEQYKDRDKEKLALKSALPKKEQKKIDRKSSMGIMTAVKLSLRNLLSKKRRTFITSLACSIGIIGIAVILAVSNGMQAYVDDVMAKSTSYNYISISDPYTEMSFMHDGQNITLPEYPENTTGVLPYERNTGMKVTPQQLDEEYIAYVEEKCEGKVVGIQYAYDVNLNVITKKSDGTYMQANTNSWHEILDNPEYIGSQYDILASNNAGDGIPTKIGDVALVVDTYNRLSTDVLDALGIGYDENLSEIAYADLLGKEFKVILNDDFYLEDSTNPAMTLYRPLFTAAQKEKAYNLASAITVKVVSVIRENKDASNSWISSGIGYSTALTNAVLEGSKTSKVALAQAESKEINVTTGLPMPKEKPGGMFGDFMGVDLPKTYEDMLKALGYTTTPSTIVIYPSDFDTKDEIIVALDAWNTVNEGTDKVVQYMDFSTFIAGMLGSVIRIITYVLTAFSAISLVISSIMIAIIIYASVIERIREIGVLRAMGARKRDIRRVFEAEAFIMGLFSGIIAIISTLVICVVINIVLESLVEVSTIATLSVGTGFFMVALAIILPLIASLIPASLASKKDPVVALRTE